MSDRSADPSTWRVAGEALRERYALDLPADVVAWLDQGVWKTGAAGEFHAGISPRVLLGSTPEPFWPPLMPPNFLPLVGNGAGDWLCLRVGRPAVPGCGSDQPEPAETCWPTDVVHWYHGGGDWLPWGRTLAEAILFDRLSSRLPRGRSRHAAPAIHFSATAPNLNRESESVVDWLREHLPLAAQDLVGTAKRGHELANALLAAGVYEVPVRCQLVCAALDHPLAAHVDARMAAELGLPWNDVMRWLFDLREMPDQVRLDLARRCNLAPESIDPGCQDWSAVTDHCAAVACRCSDLAWPHELLAYDALSHRDWAVASRQLYRAAGCSSFTDQSVRLRTHWATSGQDGAVKFALRDWGVPLHGEDETDAELHCVPQPMMLSGPIVNQAIGLEYIRRLQTSSVGTVRRDTMAWLLEQSEQYERHGNYDFALRLAMSAGWDIGAEPMAAFAEVLDRYVAVAEAADWQPHARLAETHRNCFRKRYGM